MKIHFIISNLRGGGAQRVLVLTANELSKNPNFDISIITLFEGGSDYKLNTRINKIKLNRTNFIPSHTVRSIIDLSRYYIKKKNRPQIIISFITLTNLISITVAKLFSIKVIAQEHNSYLRHMDGRKKVTDFTKKYIYKKADIVTVLTSFDVPYYEKHGVNVEVLPNPCSFKPLTDNSHSRNKTILAAGNLNRYHHKGLDNLIKLMVPIFAKHPTWKLQIAGSGDKGLMFLTKLAEQNNILDKIEFLGFVNNISEIMYNSSIFILPSRFEGLPMVVLEAMSQGMACIAYNCKTGPSDIIENNINGLLIEDQNMAKMREGLNKLIESKTERSKLSSEGIISLEKYSIANISERYENMFKKILNF